MAPHADLAWLDERLPSWSLKAPGRRGGGGAPVRAAKVTQVLELTDDALSAG